MKFKISVIIPVYNAENYIAECLESICNQGRDDVEIICVDDGSTDNSGEIILHYTKKYSYIRYIYQDNSGAPSARNYGISLAEGEYVIFFDADDLMAQGALNKMIDVIESENADIVIGEYINIDEKGTMISRESVYKYIFNYSSKWKYCCVPPLPGNKLFRMNLIKENNIKFENVKIGQDLNFYLKMLAICDKIEYINEPVMKYRIVNGSISRQYSLKILDIFNSIDNVKEYYKQLGLDEEYKKYISVVELIAYRSQFEKLPLFKNNEDRNTAKESLLKRQKSIKIRFDRLFIKKIKEKVKILIVEIKIRGMK